MFGLNEYVIAGVVSVLILGFWILSFIVAEIWRFAWAWVDDSKPAKRNFLIKEITKVIKPTWIYPVYNGEAAKKRGDVFGYAKDKKFKNADLTQQTLREGVDYKYEWRWDCREQTKACLWFLLSAPLPFIILFAIKFYMIVAIAGSLILIAHLARFARRLSKKFNIHSNDTDIHKRAKKK